MSPTLLQQIQDANKSFLAGTVRLLEASGDPFIVLACIDPRLTGVIEPALGLPRDRSIVIRTAGNRICAGSTDTLRSIAAGIFIKGATEVFVVGHTDCALASFNTAQVIESFRAAGINRSAFGDGDLREWFGAFPDIKNNVLQSIEYLRRSGILPRNARAHGLILDTSGGGLEVVWDGDAAPAEPAVIIEKAAALPHAPAPQLPPGPAHPIPPPPPAAEPSARGPVIIPLEAAVPQPIKPKRGAPTSMVQAGMILRDFVSRERKDPHFQRTLMDFRAVLRRERNPLRIFAALEEIVRDYESRYPDLPAALEYLRSSLASKDATGLTFAEAVKRVFE